MHDDRHDLELNDAEPAPATRPPGNQTQAAAATTAHNNAALTGRRRPTRGLPRRVRHLHHRRRGGRESDASLSATALAHRYYWRIKATGRAARRPARSGFHDRRAHRGPGAPAIQSRRRPRPSTDNHYGLTWRRRPRDGLQRRVRDLHTGRRRWSRVDGASIQPPALAKARPTMAHQSDRPGARRPALSGLHDAGSTAAPASREIQRRRRTRTNVPTNQSALSAGGGQRERYSVACGTSTPRRRWSRIRQVLSYQTSALAPSTTYYGASTRQGGWPTTGTIWNFTTRAAGGPGSRAIQPGVGRTTCGKQRRR